MMLKLRHLKCSICKIKFYPNIRLKERQKTCMAEACRRDHRSSYQRRWRRRNAAVESEYQEKRSKSRAKDFWKGFRKSHFESTKRNRILTKIRKRLKREGLQRKLDIVEVVESPLKIISFGEFATRHRSIILECVSRRSLLPRGKLANDHTGTSG
jgi:hypothetical protein